jgi:DNA invertase Pin-like site-specific DNA recombinase
VSTKDQHPEAQSARLREYGCAKIYTDKGVSGRLAARPQWDKCIASLQRGDTLVAVKLDRIGRSLRNVIDQVAALRDKDVDLVLLDQQIDTRTASGRLVFHIMAALAEWEADLIRERTIDGLEAARAAGHKSGRPRALTGEQVTYARQMQANGDSVATIARVLGVSRPTIYRVLEQVSAAQNGAGQAAVSPDQARFVPAMPATPPEPARALKAAVRASRPAPATAPQHDHRPEAYNPGTGRYPCGCDQYDVD